MITHFQNNKFGQFMKRHDDTYPVEN